jgi:hypothetical protein
MTLRPFVAIAMLAVACLGLAGCPASGPAPLDMDAAPAAPTASGHKVGSDVNNAFEMGVIAVETDLFQWPNTAALAVTGLAETPVGLIGPGPQPIAIGSCYFHTQAALTANNSNYETLTVAKRTNGGGATTIASVTTQITGSGNWTAFTNVPIPLAAAVEFVKPGDSITFTVTETGSGVAIPVGMLACFTTLR